MKENSSITVYGSTKSQSLFAIIKESILSLFSGFGLAKQLAERDIRAMYRQSALGMLWAVFIPIAQTLIWVLLSKAGVLSIGDTGVPYPLFVLVGTMLWQTFIESITAPLNMFNSAKSILSKINFNKESLVVAGMLKVLFNLGIRLLVLIPVMLYYHVTFTSTILLAPVAILLVVIFGLVIGILITPAGVLYQDVSRIVQSFSQLFFFLTPIIYPSRTEGLWAMLDKWNPAAISICTARDLFLGQGFSDPYQYIYFVIAIFILGIVGLGLYRISLPIIIERMGS